MIRRLQFAVISAVPILVFIPLLLADEPSVDSKPELHLPAQGQVVLELKQGRIQISSPATVADFKQQSDGALIFCDKSEMTLKLKEGSKVHCTGRVVLQTGIVHLTADELTFDGFHALSAGNVVLRWRHGLAKDDEPSVVKAKRITLSIPVAKLEIPLKLDQNLFLGTADEAKFDGLKVDLQGNVVLQRWKRNGALRRSTTKAERITFDPTSNTLSVN